jgi:riboflavin biosynthesis pyrimidine reductase
VPADAPDAPRFRSLIPWRAEHQTLSGDEALRDWRAAGGEDQLRVALNMIVSLDGRIAVDGRSAPLGGPADRALFHALRAHADAVMVGAETVRAERYGPIIRKPEARAWRVRQGLPEQPLAVIVSRRLELDPSLPLLADPDAHVVVLTPSAGALPRCAANIDYVRAATLRAGLAEVRTRWGVRLVLCEGGPTLNGALAAESLIDELFLAISPLIVGDSRGGGGLLSGGAPREPLALELRMLLEHDSQLYAHYVSRARGISPSGA